jgi:hypothetical protein
MAVVKAILASEPSNAMTIALARSHPPEPSSAAQLLAALFRRKGDIDRADEWTAKVPPTTSRSVEPCQALAAAPAGPTDRAHPDVMRSEIPIPCPAESVHSDTLGASYTPVLNWTNDEAGGRCDLLDWHDPTVMRMRPEVPDVDDQAEQLHADMDDPDPLVRCPPIEEPTRSE